MTLYKSRFVIGFLLQIKNFKEKHEEDLSTVKRTLGQMIQKTETNIAWMEKNYEEISNWLSKHRNGDILY